VTVATIQEAIWAARRRTDRYLRTHNSPPNPVVILDRALIQANSGIWEIDVTTLLHRFRGPLVALVVLMLSATVAFAGQPAGPGKGLEKSSSHADQTVSTTETDETDTETTETSETETSSESDNCTTDPTGLTPEQLGAMTHGSIVCWAAQQDTPDGYANHGAWVSHWAHMGKGADAAAKGKAHKPSH